MGRKHLYPRAALSKVSSLKRQLGSKCDLLATSLAQKVIAQNLLWLYVCRHLLAETERGAAGPCLGLLTVSSDTDI